MSPVEFQSVSALFIACVAVVVHHYAFSVKELQKELGDRDGSKSVVAHRVMGGVLLGVLPLLLSVPLLGGPVGLGVSGLGDGTFAALVLGIVGVLVVWSGPVSPAIHEIYPMIRKENWTDVTHVSSTISWLIYLMGYEYLYRGFLLFTLVDSMGTVLAVAVSTVVYVLHHLPKAKEETYASILMGLVLGGLAIWSGGFWAAFLLHSIVAIMGEQRYLQTHPVIRG